MMQMNIERMINATGSLLIWLVMILAAVILAGLIIIAAKAISQGIKGVPVAYVQYNKLHIENVEAVRRWSVGAADDGGYFDFISTQYGMGVKWREAEQVEETATQSVKRQKQKQEYRQLIDDDGIFEVVKV